MNETLSTEERERLAVLEATIERGTRAFAETGRALAEVRDMRLYRESHETFEAYAADRYDISRQQAYRLIDAAGVLEAMSPTGDAPKSERQARELAPLRDRPEEMAAAWRTANETAAAQHRAVTAEDVRAAVRPPAVEEPAEPIRLVAPPENDTRFEMIDDAVELLRMLGAPEDIVFPVQDGDVEAVDEAVKWLTDWTPRVAKAWRAHRAALRQARAA